MYVPNYVPEPLEVPGNITLDSYGERVRFVRRVSLLHAISLGIVALLATLPMEPLGVMAALGALTVLLIGLDLLRIALRGRPLEATLSTAFLPVVLSVAGWTVREAANAGLPVIAILAGPLFALLYTLLCGRDYSFVGCGMLSLIASSVTLSALAPMMGWNARAAAWALGGNAAYLLYFVYDLASLMARRRKGEELAAVTDLYRDVFNIFGWTLRVIGHWRKHKIWAR